MTTRIAAFLWTILIIVASLMPKSSMGDSGLFEIPFLDKIVHIFLYAIFVYLWSRNLFSKVDKVKAARLAFYSSIVFGVVMEVLQKSLGGGRNFDVLDIIANIIGSIIGLIAFYKIIKL